MKTVVTRTRVKKIAVNYLLPEPYETNHERTIDFCMRYIVFSPYVSIEDGFILASDQDLKMVIDEYFNL